MGRKKIAHEAPISLFDTVQLQTGYDYCLVHLYAENEKYRNKFKEAKGAGREVLLDNSIFELGEAFDTVKYLEVIKELQPDWYIIPDVLEDGMRTSALARQWVALYSREIKSESKGIGVIQGKTYEEIVGCYKVLDEELNIPKIAISFDYSYYEKSVPHPNKLVSWMLGRVKLLGDLLNDGIINQNKPHHLLGVALPMEGKFYGRYKWIESVDTSNPVVHALKGIEYQANIGLYDKERQKLFEMINFEEKDLEIKTVQEKLLAHNIAEFNKYWNFETF